MPDTHVPGWRHRLHEIREAGPAVSTQACLQCGGEGHAVDARQRKYRGAHLADGQYPTPTAEA